MIMNIHVQYTVIMSIHVQYTVHSQSNCVCHKFFNNWYSYIPDEPKQTTREIFPCKARTCNNIHSSTSNYKVV